MPKPTVIPGEKFEFIVLKIVKACIDKAGSEIQLSRDLPMSASYICQLQKGQKHIGPTILFRMLEYLELFDTIDRAVDQKLGGQ